MRQIRKQELGFDDFFSVLHCRNGIAAPCRQLAGLRCEFPVFGENLLARALFGRCVIGFFHIDIAEVRDAGHQGAARRAFAFASKLFNWAIERGIVEASPCTSVKPAAPVAEEFIQRHVRKLARPDWSNRG
jgi:hypothetical protein